VDDSVIPEAGRDVQCSNCGHAWFQMSATQLNAQAEREAELPEETSATAVDWVDEVADAGETPAEVLAGKAEPEDVPDDLDVETGPEPTAAAAEAEPLPASEPEPAPEPEPRRKTLDDAVVNVLREEADRERRAREAEGSVIETQPDLGLAAVTAVAPVAAALARRDDAEAPEVFTADDDDDDAIVSRASRRELLPDIEEINSTLRATSDRGGEAASVDAPATLRRRRSGFRMGFSTSILVAALLLLLYVMAPTIAEKAPATASAMATYVSLVDSARAWLDSTLRDLTASMKGDG
jgi:hypothetical protein